MGSGEYRMTRPPVLDGESLDLPYAGRPSREVTRQRQPSRLPVWLGLASFVAGAVLAAVVGWAS